MGVLVAPNTSLEVDVVEKYSFPVLGYIFNKRRAV